MVLLLVALPISAFSVLAFPAAAGTTAPATYVKVTSAPTDWSGTYIVAYEYTESSVLKAKVWNGLDAANNNVAAIPSNNKIAGDFVTFTVRAMNGGYSITVNDSTNDGKFVSGKSGKNQNVYGTSAVAAAFAYDGNGVLITSNTSVLRYNSTSSANWFRFFKASTYASQKPIQLYKLLEGPQLDSLSQSRDSDSEQRDYLLCNNIELHRCECQGGVFREGGCRRRIYGSCRKYLYSYRCR